MEDNREPCDTYNQNTEPMNELESSRVRTKLLKDSALQKKKGRWWFLSQYDWQQPSSVSSSIPRFTVGRHSQASESSFLF